MSQCEYCKLKNSMFVNPIAITVQDKMEVLAEFIDVDPWNIVKLPNSLILKMHLRWNHLP